MRKFTTYLFWLLFTPLISFLCWLFASHQLTQYLNIIFYVSFIFVIILFSLIIVQEGILDATSYGFRRLKYQLTNKKHKDTLENDDFFKPTQAKKSSYFVNPWIKVGFVFNLLYLLISIAISFII
ncbi:MULTISPECIES: DUF3899 domain-containing protein [Staphylococcus]|uniref:DUF3899 domain-containing protein n=1 Tax=Staphylococcus TaxID=1279 RepID=UPI00094B7C86|nr:MULTISPECIES: DUF3899 domain-containing protein [Staphylococcus]MBF2752464.1 DUF3899 domain-containing protein [Staphylococcus saprophyticus]MBF2781001.1 DUF3899 domain-containing protein [Staphylococcus saprophyticus]MBN6203748.1 DUF3899 domain-containing protein [Staphylococcus saprophyticus]MCC4220480.1 DUF3899 domain-containing protein [Staphylococcus saprophyticus]MDL1996016.1 DUF3899 domain-containing protein [Staphylococcus saprophyticus]